MQIAHSTPFPNQVLDEYWPKVSPTEAKILGTIIRSTLGWLDKHTGKRKTRDWISHSQMALRSGLSDRTITTGIQSLIEKRMIEVTDSRGFSLADPKKRKFTQRIFYALKVDSLAQVADNQSKKYAQATQDLHRTPQELRTTQNNPTQKQFSKPHNRKLTDAERIQEIKWKQHQKKC